MILSPPVCQRVPGTSHDWILRQDWRLCLDQFSKRYPELAPFLKGRKLLVKTGFRWDGGSIPDGLWGWFLGDEQTYPVAYLAHDATYQAELFPRAVCDNLLYYCLKAEGAWWIQRHVIYRAVRDCGGIVWTHHTEHSVDDARQYVELVSCYS